MRVALRIAFGDHGSLNENKPKQLDIGTTEQATHGIFWADRENYLKWAAVARHELIFSQKAAQRRQEAF